MKLKINRRALIDALHSTFDNADDWDHHQERFYLLSNWANKTNRRKLLPQTTSILKDHLEEQLGARDAEKVLKHKGWDSYRPGGWFNLDDPEAPCSVRVFDSRAQLWDAYRNQVCFWAACKMTCFEDLEEALLWLGATREIHQEITDYYNDILNAEKEGF